MGQFKIIITGENDGDDGLSEVAIKVVGHGQTEEDAVSLDATKLQGSAAGSVWLGIGEILNEAHHQTCPDGCHDCDPEHPEFSH